MKQVETSLRAIEEERQEIAKVYAGAPSHSAIEKLTKARNELMQTELDM